MPYNRRMTVGNLADATIAATCPRDLKIGEGWTREVFRIGDVVYKVDMEQGEPNNWDEFTNIDRLRGLMPADILLPEVSMWEVNGESIIAMEYIDGIPTGECSSAFFGTEPCACNPGECLTDEFLYPLRKLNITDIGYGNLILTAEGKVYLIDAVV